MARNFHISIGEFYHVYNRGVEKREIFLEDIDYQRFQLLLYLCNSDQPVRVRDILQSALPLSELYLKNKGNEIVEIGAYCLMPNHYHLLLREKVEGGISMFMKKLSNAYTGSFNKKYKHSGALFQGRFRAKHVGDEMQWYLNYLFSYIHLNPVKMIDPNWKEEGVKDLKKTKGHLSEYPYSSFQDFIGLERNERKILNLDNFPEFFETTKQFDDFIDTWLTYKNNTICNP